MHVGMVEALLLRRRRRWFATNCNRLRGMLPRVIMAEMMLCERAKRVLLPVDMMLSSCLFGSVRIRITSFMIVIDRKSTFANHEIGLWITLLTLGTIVGRTTSTL